MVYFFTKQKPCNTLIKRMKSDICESNCPFDQCWSLTVVLAHVTWHAGMSQKPQGFINHQTPFVRLVASQIFNHERNQFEEVLRWAWTLVNPTFPGFVQETSDRGKIFERANSLHDRCRTDGMGETTRGMLQAAFKGNSGVSRTVGRIANAWTNRRIDE